jgi:hypothetical protein
VLQTRCQFTDLNLVEVKRYSADFADSHRLMHLRDSLSDALHSLEASMHQVSTSVSVQLHAVGWAVRHPRESISNFAAMRPHNFTAGMQHLRDGFEHSLATLQHSVSDNLVSLQHELQNLRLSSIPELLESWLKDVVVKSVQWPVARWPLYLYMAGAMTCLLTSAVCHLFGSSNRQIWSFIWRLDYAGAPPLLSSQCDELENYTSSAA